VLLGNEQLIVNNVAPNKSGALYNTSLEN